MSVVISVLENTAEELSANRIFKIDNGNRKRKRQQIGKKFWQGTHLSHYVRDGSGRHSSHSVNTSITGACGFVHIIDRAWRCEDMFKALEPALQPLEVRVIIV